MENNYFKNEFYHQISALEDVSSDLKTLIEKNESGFYEVCKKYAEIVFCLRENAMVDVLCIKVLYHFNQ